jgi:hypothetical protein
MEARFDIATRYYLPKEPIVNGEWLITRPQEADT